MKVAKKKKPLQQQAFAYFCQAIHQKTFFQCMAAVRDHSKHYFLHPKLSDLQSRCHFQTMFSHLFPQNKLTPYKQTDWFVQMGHIARADNDIVQSHNLKAQLDKLSSILQDTDFYYLPFLSSKFWCHDKDIKVFEWSFRYTSQPLIIENFLFITSVNLNLIRKFWPYMWRYV